MERTMNKKNFGLLNAFFLVTVLLNLTLIANARANPVELAEASDPYYQIESMEVQALPFDDQELADLEQDNLVMNREVLKSLPQVIATVDGLIALGKKIWPIIEAGRPVSNARFNTVDVIPQGTTAMEMEGWQAPKGLRWRVSYKNFYGVEVIGFTYAVLFQYAGSKDGRGRYLTGVFVEASDVTVSWGFDFNATSEAITIANVGTKANPVASLMLRINYQAKSVFRDITNQKTVYLTGTGQISEL
jgi:hypothetical protein